MRKILLISDTHGFFDERLRKHIADADEIWHAGDIGSAELLDELTALKPIKAVYGNIDGQQIRKDCAETLIFDCELVKVCITHIGGYPGKYPARIRKMLIEEQPALFICGHSHILKVIYDKELQHLHINPGACGVQGFHQFCTAVRFAIEGKTIKDLSVIELGRRAG